MKLFISFALAVALLLPVSLYAKEAPKTPVKKAATAKSATQIQKKSASKIVPIKKTVPKGAIVPVKKSTPTAAMKKPASLPPKKPSAQKPPSPTIIQSSPLNQSEAAEVQPQTSEKKVEPPPSDTKSKAKELLKKLEAIKQIEPIKVTPIQKPALPEQKYWLDQPTQDAPVRDYYKEHPGSYSPPLLKYDLPSGVY